MHVLLLSQVSSNKNWQYRTDVTHSNMNRALIITKRPLIKSYLLTAIKIITTIIKKQTHQNLKF